MLSKSDNLVQLADMVAGPILRTQSKKSDSKDYLGVIQKHIEHIWYLKEKNPIPIDNKQKIYRLK